MVYKCDRQTDGNTELPLGRGGAYHSLLCCGMNIHHPTVTVIQEIEVATQSHEASSNR